MEIGNINLLSSKIRDLIADQELKDIDRPLDPAILKGLFSNVVETVRSNFNSYTKEQQKSSVAENVKENPEAFISLVNVWNQSIGLISAMEDLVTNSTKRYNQEIKDNLAETKEQVRPMVYKIKTIHKAVQTTYPDLGKIIPAIKSN